METIRQKAIQLLQEFKGENYVFGADVENQLGKQAAKMGKKVSVVVGSLGNDWMTPYLQNAEKSLLDAGLEISGPFIKGARPNSPREDVAAIKNKILEQNPDVVISFGSGSTIDAVKASICHGLP